MQDSKSALSHPVFIHAGFRTSSTFVINALEARSKQINLYEPLHEGLSAPPGLFARGTLAGMEAPVGGLRGYRKSFSSERLFLADDEEHPLLETYLGLLLDHARWHEARAIVKEVRSQGRIGWIRRRFGGFHIALIRNPREQFRSYLWNARHSNWYFLAKTCQDYAFNTRSGSDVNRYLNIPVFWSENFAEEISFYERWAKTMPVPELYFIFYHLWLRCTREAVKKADLCLELPLSPTDAVRLDRVLDAQDLALPLTLHRGSSATNDDYESTAIDDAETLAVHLADLPSLSPPAARCDTLFLHEGTIGKMPFLAGSATRSLDGYRMFRHKGLARLMERERQVSGTLVGTDSPFVAFGHRRDADPDTVQRFSPTALYRSGGAVLSQGDPDGVRSIAFVGDLKSQVCFGPHIDLPAGRYRFDYAIDLRRKVHGDQPARAFLEVVANRDGTVLAEETGHDVQGRATIGVEFTTGREVSAVEVRLQVISAEIRVYELTLTRLETSDAGNGGDAVSAGTFTPRPDRPGRLDRPPRATAPSG